MALTLDTFAEVLRGLNDLASPSRKHLGYILEGGELHDENPYSLREIADFLVGVDEYIDGAAELAGELAEIAGEAGIYQTGGRTKMAPKKKAKKEEEELDDSELDEEEEEEDEEDDEEEEEEGEEEEEEEEEGNGEEEEETPQPKRRAKSKAKTKPKAARKAKPKTKTTTKRRRSSDRNAPVPVEDRVPALIAALGNFKNGATINELYHKLTRTKSGEALFPTRRRVKSVLTAREGEEVERGESNTIWQLAKGGTKKAKKTTKKAKKGAAKKRSKK